MSFRDDADNLSMTVDDSQLVCQSLIKQAQNGLSIHCRPQEDAILRRKAGNARAADRDSDLRSITKCRLMSLPAEHFSITGTAEG